MLKIGLFSTTALALSFAGACGAQWCCDQRYECLAMWCILFSCAAGIASIVIPCAVLSNGDPTQC